MHHIRWTTVSALAILTVFAVGCSGDEASQASATPGAASGAATTTAQSASGGTTAKAEISNFTLPSVMVKVGTVVEFSNKDSAPHTATSDDKTTFDSKTLQPGTGTYQFTASKAGAFPYSCMIHPTMTGTITVQ